jgi:hypothetical protein
MTGFSAQNQSYATASSSTVVRVDLPEIRNTWWDPTQSYLKFTITTSGAAEIDTNAGAVWSRIELYSAGQSNLLCSILDGYNLLNQILWDTTSSITDQCFGYSVTSAFSNTNQRRGESINGARTVILPLIDFAGMGTNKNIPFQGFTILLTAANSAEAFISAQAITYSLSQIEYYASLHELAPDIHGALMASSGPSLLIPATSWRRFTAPPPQT